MNAASELAPLNLVLQLITESAALDSASAVPRLVPARQRWILEFATCRLSSWPTAKRSAVRSTPPMTGCGKARCKRTTAPKVD
jgi:hypothetical protein